MSTTLKYILGSVLLVGSFFGVGLWILNEDYKYEKEHPIVCAKQSAVKEVESIDGAYAILKLQNEEVVRYRIRHNQMVRNVHNKYSTYTSREVYTSVKPGDILCLKYVRK